ncbi:MAG: NUDIX hydrolase [bacterium]|nr:NUDIX hydrolase [bacterium]
MAHSRVISRRVLFDGDPWMRLVALTVQRGGERIEWTAVERKAGDRLVEDIVAVFAVTEDGDVVCTELLRPPLVRDVSINRSDQVRTLELPAGLCDMDSETLKSAARRELREETGYEAAEFIRIPVAPESAGMARTRVYLLLASGCRKVCEPDLEKAERVMQLQTVLLPLDRLPEALARYRLEHGTIIDHKIAAGAFWWKHYQERPRTA